MKKKERILTACITVFERTFHRKDKSSLSRLSRLTTLSVTHSSVIRTYEDVAWREISGKEIDGRENIGPIAITNELSTIRAASVRIGSNPIYSHTSTFVYVFSFSACEAGDWGRRERNRWRAEGPTTTTTTTNRARMRNAAALNSTGLIDFTGKIPRQYAHVHLLAREVEPAFAQRREISPIHPCNCAKSNCIEANRVVLD